MRTRCILGPASVTAAFMLVLSLLWPAPYTVRADGGWLDAPSPENWNAPGMSILAAPAVDLPVDPRAAAREREPETEEDTALIAAGWRLFTAYEAGWETKVIQAAAGYDGMGRPLQYQAFVFVDGRLAGTLSPTLMDARTDGVLVRAALTGGGRIIGEFRRYAPTDPLCCPSGSAAVEYRISRQPDGPVVMPVNVTRQGAGSP